MGLTNFVNNILANARHSPRHSQSPHDTSPPADRPPKSGPRNPPRRRRHQPVHLTSSHKDDWTSEWEPDWLKDDEPVSREFDPRRMRRHNRRHRRHLEEPVSASSSAFPSRAALKSFDDEIPDWQSRPSLPLKDRLDERYDAPSSRSRRQNRDGPPSRRLDREDRDIWSPRREERDGPSSRRLTVWRRRAGRTKSNIEESIRSHEPATSSPLPSPTPASPLPADYDAPVIDSPSKKGLLATARAAASKQFQEATRFSDSFFRADTPSGPRQMPKRDSSSSHDDSSRRGSAGTRESPHRRRAGRIMSNIDQLIRRDGPRSSDSRSSGHRRFSTLSEASGYVDPSSMSSSEPISFVNESYVPPEPETRQMPKVPTPPKQQQQHKPPVKFRQMPPSKPPPLPPPNGSRSKPSRTSLPFPVEGDFGGSISARRPPVREGEQKMRFSAEAVFPPRPRETMSQAFARSQSNPAPPTQPTAPGLKRAHLKRPPPLLPPVNGSPGFAFGVGADSSGIRRVSIGRDGANQPDKLDKDRRSIDFPATTSAVTEESDFNDITATPLESSAKGLPEMDAETIPEPKAYAKSDIWNTDDSKSGMRDTNRVRSDDVLGSHVRHPRKLSAKEQELFYFEEASQSSFDNTESPSKLAARNGIVPMDQRAKAGEVMEDNFVFGADESFSDGGFIISSDGRVDLPEKVTRKMSDGLAVDGVPSSSSNVILVRDLTEFRKKYAFTDRSSHNNNPTLGRGAAGKVYLAVHEPSGLKIAVKEINIFDQDKRDQFKKELVTLIGHQSRFLVRSYGAFYGGNGAVHVALEYMDRGSLSDVIAQMGPIPEPVVRKIAEHCLRGLCFLHDNHILHRDVKTGNILLSRKLCRAKLSDFGLARNFKEGRGKGENTGDGSSVTHTFVGTVLYMSPERLNGDEYTYASDIWGVGMAILECILGRYPFDKPQSYFDILVSAKSAPCALDENDNVSDELGDFIALATHNDPKQRPTARGLLSHPWIQKGQENATVLRDWLDSIPRLHCQNVEVGSELAVGARQRKGARAMEKIRAKAKEANRNM